MLRSAKVGFDSVKGTTEVWLRLKSGALKGLNRRFPGSQPQLIQDCKAYKRQMFIGSQRKESMIVGSRSQLIEDCKAYKRQMFIGSQRKECRTVDCNAKNISPKKIMQMIRMNSYLHRKAALSFSTSSNDGETRDLQDLFVKTCGYLLHVDLKNYKFHHTVASLEEGLPKVDVLTRHDHPYTSYPGNLKREPVSPTPVRDPDSGLGVSKSGPKKYMLGGSVMWKVYEYNPSENWMKESPTIFRYLHAVLVEEIGGKIYVAHTYSCYYRSPILMEVLDPSSANPCWEELPHLLGPIVYGSHYVLGHKLYVISRDYEIFYYDTVEMIWERVNYNHMFKYGFSLNGCYKHDIVNNSFPENGKMVSEDIAIAFRPTPIPDLSSNPNFDMDDPCMRKHHLFGYLYSKDGCLLAIQDLGDVFDREDELESNHFLIAMKDGKFCAVARCWRAKLVLAVSIFSVTKLPKAAELQDKAAELQDKETSRHVPPASALPPTSPEEEKKFLSISIGKQYFFDLRGLEDSFIVGAFFA